MFGEVSEPIRKIATLLPDQRRAARRRAADQRVPEPAPSLFVQQQEEAQLLTGSGTAPNLRGLIGTTRTIGTYNRGTDDNATALFKAMNLTRGSRQLDVDTIVINPTNWQALRLAKDSSGQFFGGGPSLAHTEARRVRPPRASSPPTRSGVSRSSSPSRSPSARRSLGRSQREARSTAAAG